MGSSVLDTLLVIKLVELFAVDHMRPATSEDGIQGPDTETKGWDSTVTKVETHLFACESVLLVDGRSNQMYSNERWHDESANDRRRVGFTRHWPSWLSVDEGCVCQRGPGRKTA